MNNKVIKYTSMLVCLFLLSLLTTLIFMYLAGFCLMSFLKYLAFTFISYSVISLSFCRLIHIENLYAKIIFLVITFLLQVFVSSIIMEKFNSIYIKGATTKLKSINTVDFYSSCSALLSTHEYDFSKDKKRLKEIPLSKELKEMFRPINKKLPECHIVKEEGIYKILISYNSVVIYYYDSLRIDNKPLEIKYFFSF